MTPVVFRLYQLCYFILFEFRIILSRVVKDGYKLGGLLLRKKTLDGISKTSGALPPY